MSRQLRLIIVLLLMVSTSSAAIRPVNNARLNYTQVMFEYDEVPGADKYVLTVMPIKDSASRPITITSTSLANMLSGFRWGKTYFWNYEAFAGDRSLFKSQQFMFTIVSSFLVDPKMFRSRVTASSPNEMNNDILFLDYRGIAIDRQGQPVWYYPNNSLRLEQDPLFRNLRMTNDGTITYLDDSSCYEVNLEGLRLWRAPDNGKISGDDREHYHHDFKKLEDGTYLTAGWKYVYEPNLFNPSLRSQVRYNTLIQYDARGNVLWHWNEKDHVSKETIFGVYGPADSIIPGTHMNAFDYDPKENAIYISCRHNSSILKIDKKTGNVIYTMGVYDNNKKSRGMQPLFLHQHGVAIMPDHQLTFYDNNSSDDPNRSVSFPWIVIMKEPSKNLPAYKAWEYECKSDRFPNGILGKGGYVMPLPNNNLLVCMGGANYAFEINLKKQIVWQCFFEKYDSINHNWIDFQNYRCTYSSSLYPFYFTVQQLEKKNSNVVIKLNNDGTEDDDYLVELKTADGKLLHFEQVHLKKNSEQKLQLKLKSKYQKKDIQVVVSRKFNPNQSRTLLFNKPV